MSPDKRHHRGPHPQDLSLFSQSQYPALHQAFHDLLWLLNHDYALNSSMKLVGDKFGLNKRQRLAVTRSICTDEQLKQRHTKGISLEKTSNRALLIDGFNILITLESALSGGLILKSKDGCYRDLASVHGSYRSVDETTEALKLVGNCLSRLHLKEVIWYLDKPVSNSGKLASHIRKLAGTNHWPWQVEVVFNPDAVLKQAEYPVVTSDSSILDEVALWINLARTIIDSEISSAWIVDFV